MKSGTIVTFKYYKNVKKLEDVGIILELQHDFLIFKESVGFTYEDLLRIYWFTRKSERLPFFKTDYLKRKWYLRDNVHAINKEMRYGEF